MDAAELRDLSVKEVRNWIEGLVKNGIPEGYTIDYKRLLDLDSKDGPAGLAKDLSAFANTAGGALVVGIEEQDGVPVLDQELGTGQIPGLLDRSVNVLSDAVTPRLSGHVFREVPLDGSRYAYVLAVPESWTGPHMVSSYKDGRFYRRAERRAEPMSEEMVAAAYRARAARETALENFLGSAELQAVPSAYRGTLNFRIAAVPDFQVPSRMPVTRSFLDRLHAVASAVLQSHRGWTVTPWGAHTQLLEHYDDSYVRWYETGAAVMWRVVECYRPENGTAEVLPVHHLTQSIAQFLRFLSAALRGADGSPRRYSIDIRFQLPNLEVVHETAAFPARFAKVVADLDPWATISLRTVWESPDDDVSEALLPLVHQLGRYFGDDEYQRTIIRDQGGQLAQRIGRSVYSL